MAFTKYAQTWFSPELFNSNENFSEAFMTENYVPNRVILTVLSHN